MNAATPCPGEERLEEFVHGGERDAALAAHIDGCESCGRATARIRLNNDLLADVVRANATPPGDSPRDDGLPSIEGYTLIGEIHRGAQGVVYRAVQEATRREVAVKTLGHGAFASGIQRRRFEREVELVAALRHPNIVTIHDSGRTAGGGYYLTMELVEGVPLDEYVRGLPPARPKQAHRRVAAVMAKICAAVRAAHQRGIIHRDLKPANILVDADGEPHVLDFGLARPQFAGEQEDEHASTIAGQFLGTFAYAAPEQVRGDPRAIDVRTDVYALGVIAYELLAGERPYRLAGGVAEVVRTILHDEPEPLETRAGSVDDELRTIVHKSLDKDPDRRYHSAGALYEDLVHYLAGEAINAKRDSQWYLLTKTASRHRVGLAVATAFMVLVFAFAINMFRLYRQAETARSRTRDTLASFLDLLAMEPLQRKVGVDTLPRIFQEADRIVSEQLIDQPDIAAAIRHNLGVAQLENGEYDYALKQLALAHGQMTMLEHVDPETFATCTYNYARALWFSNRFDDAETMYLDALDRRIALHGENSEPVAETLHHLGAAARGRGRYEVAEDRYRRSLQVRREIGAPGGEVAKSLNSLGVLLKDQRRYEDASDIFREVLEIIRASDDPSLQRGLAAVLHNLGLCRLGLGDHEEAGSLLDESLAIKRIEFEDSDPRLIVTRVAQARVRMARGDIEGADVLVRDALAAQEAAYREDRLETADALTIRGRIGLRRNEHGAAAIDFERALSIRRNHLPANHWLVAESAGLLGRCREREGNHDEAMKLLRESAEIFQSVLGAEDELTKEAVERLRVADGGATTEGTE